MTQIIDIANISFTRQQLIDKFNIPQDSTVLGCNLIHADSQDKIEKLKFLHFMESFPADGFASKTYSKLYDLPCIHHDKFDVFDKRKVNAQVLSTQCDFGPSQSQSFVTNFQDKYLANGIDLWRVIYSLGVNGCGKSTAIEFAKKFAGIDYSFESKTRSVIKELESLESFIGITLANLQTYGYTIKFPEVAKVSSTSSKKYMLTGSPKEFGFKTKADFTSTIHTAIETSKIKDADMLITDDLSSKSSKMSAAKKLGIQIVTYAQAAQILNS